VPKWPIAGQFFPEEQKRTEHAEKSGSLCRASKRK